MDMNQQFANDGGNTLQCLFRNFWAGVHRSALGPGFPRLFMFRGGQQENNTSAISVLLQVFDVCSSFIKMRPNFAPFRVQLSRI
jgi:hypothetical protein